MYTNKIPNWLEKLIQLTSSGSTTHYFCNICRGNNSLVITKESGELKWFCHKCKFRGVSTYKRTRQELTGIGLGEAKEEFRLPDYLVWGISSKKTLQMLSRYNCMDVYSKGWFDCAYDPLQDRVCLIIKKDNKPVGMIGRAVSKGIHPKTLNYPLSDPNMPFLVGVGKTLCLTEDCFSAISSTRLEGITGLAILGTSLKNSYLTYVKDYDKILVCLDADAKKKAIAIKSKLCYYHDNVTVVNMSKDIKDMTNEEILNLDKLC